MVILGLDPGTATTGYGLIKQNPQHKEEFELLDFGVITTKKGESDAARLEVLAKDLSAIFKRFKPGRVGIERLFFATNRKTAMTVSQARGAVLLICQQNRVPVFEFTPLQVKNTLCGYGKADKRQVQFMVQQTFKLKSLPRPDDAADALAIALCAAFIKKSQE